MTPAAAPPAARRPRTPPAPLSDGRRDLAARYADSVRRSADFWVRKFPRLRDEIQSEAALRLVRCAARWDEGSGVKFGTYLFPQVRYAILDVVRSRSRRRAAGPLDEDAMAPALARTYPQPLDEGDAVRAVLAGLPGDHKRLMALVHADGCAIPEAGRRLGVKPTRAYGLHAASLNLLRGDRP